MNHSSTKLIHVLAAGAAAAPLFAQASFQTLGRLPGGASSADAAGISADGRVVVGSSGSALAYWGESYRWTADGGIMGLGRIAGVAQSDALNVSPDGQWVSGRVVHESRRSEAYIWHESTGGLLLGDLGGEESQSWASGVSRGGRVVVGTASNAGGPQAFRWTPDEGMTGLGFQDNATTSHATAVSADGTRIVGGSSEAFLWTETEGMVGLGRISDERSTGATGISDNGRWIVGSGGIRYDHWGYTSEALLWSDQGELIRLGQLGDSGTRYSYAYDVSDNGRVVVGMATWSGDDHHGWGQAMIWTPEWGMRRLEEVLLTEYGLDIQALGWRLDSALGVSADGRYITGNAFTWLGDNARLEGFRVELPIPAPASLAPLALAGALALRRRR